MSKYALARSPNRAGHSRDTLPRRALRVDASPRRLTRASPNTDHGRVVLLIEDDVDTRLAYQELLELSRLLPIMALTGHSLTRDEQAKFSAVLRKPVDLDAVAVWLRVVSAAAQSAREHR